MILLSLITEDVNLYLVIFFFEKFFIIIFILFKLLLIKNLLLGKG